MSNHSERIEMFYNVIIGSIKRSTMECKAVQGRTSKNSTQTTGSEEKENVRYSMHR